MSIEDMKSDYEKGEVIIQFQIGDDPKWIDAIPYGEDDLCWDERHFTYRIKP